MNDWFLVCIQVVVVYLLCVLACCLIGMFYYVLLYINLERLCVQSMNQTELIGRSHNYCRKFSSVLLISRSPVLYAHAVQRPLDVLSTV